LRTDDGGVRGESSFIQESSRLGETSDGRLGTKYMLESEISPNVHKVCSSSSPLTVASCLEKSKTGVAGWVMVGEELSHECARRAGVEGLDMVVFGWNEPSVFEAERATKSHLHLHYVRMTREWLGVCTRATVVLLYCGQSSMPPMTQLVVLRIRPGRNNEHTASPILTARQVHCRTF